MKKVKGLLSVGLLSLIVAVSASCNTPKVVDNVDLKEAITLFNEATSYDLTGNVPVQTQAYKNGFSTQISSRAEAIEYNFTDLTTNTILGSYGYANHPEGVMEYTVAHRLSLKRGKPRTFLAISGVTCYKSLEAALAEVKSYDIIHKHKKTFKDFCSIEQQFKLSK